MRDITDLLPDVRLVAAGVPGPVATYALTKALAEFLDRSEAWRDWLETATEYNAAYVSGGLLRIDPDDASIRWKRIKRIDSLRWSDDGRTIPFRTANQLQCIDPMWRSKEGTRPEYYTHEGEAAPEAEGEPSQFQIRVYPMPVAADTEGYIEARAVYVTDTVSNAGLDGFDGDIPSVPDRIYYAFKDGIVSGALAYLLSMPNKDWTAVSLVPLHNNKFESVIARAQSRADRDGGNAPLVAAYGGL